MSEFLAIIGGAVGAVVMHVLIERFGYKKAGLVWLILTIVLVAAHSGLRGQL